MTKNNHRDTMPEPRPLWAVMDSASWNRMKQGPYAPQDIRAAELRAPADVVVPDRTQPSTLELCYDEDDEREWHYEQRTRAVLLAEAERAERGEANG